MVSTSSRFSALQISIATHIGVVALILVLNINWAHFKKQQIVDLDVIVTAPSQLVLQPKNLVPEAKPPPPLTAPRQVFGVSRNAITTKQSGENTAEVKQGNTVAKADDNLKLNADDADSLPIPADDYLVTESPQLISEINAVVTEEARKADYTGTAILILLIGSDGRVRDAQLTNKLDYGLDQVAVESAKKLLFKPAKIGADPVAVKIRFRITFRATH